MILLSKQVHLEQQGRYIVLAQSEKVKSAKVLREDQGPQFDTQIQSCHVVEHLLIHLLFC